MSTVAIMLFTLDTVFLYERLCVSVFYFHLLLRARAGEGGGCPLGLLEGVLHVGVHRWVHPTWTKSGPIAY